MSGYQCEVCRGGKLINECKSFVKLLPLFLIASFGNDIPITALLDPKGLNAGGATGVATVLGTITHLQLMITYGVVNLPILILGIRFLNLRFSLYSVFVTILTTIMFPYLEPFTIQMNPYVSIFIAALVYGISIGISYRYDFSLGGFALLAKVLEVWTHRQVGTLFSLINFVPVLLSFLLNPSITTLLESVAFIYLTGIVINSVTMGQSYLKYCQKKFMDIIQWPWKVVHTTAND